MEAKYCLHKVKTHIAINKSWKLASNVILSLHSASDFISREDDSGQEQAEVASSC